jgi:hypothetical protein
VLELLDLLPEESHNNSQHSRNSSDTDNLHVIALRTCLKTPQQRHATASMPLDRPVCDNMLQKL